MRLIRGISNLQKKFKHPVLTIGVFDGMHIAHQKIIKEVVRQAKILQGTSIVLTFNLHPSKIVEEFAPTPLICSLEHRIELMRKLNVDVCLLLDFNKRFSQILAEDFVQHIIVDTIRVNYLIVGEGFRFGKEKRGGFALFKKLSKLYGFKILQIKTIKINGQRVCSTNIRQLIRSGQIDRANQLLGRKFSIYGRVKKGSARGRILGYPTANIQPEQEIIPAFGVYAVWVKLDEQFFAGILYVGVRPTFNSQESLSFPSVEVHIFNFHKRIYGKKLEVFFIRRIRPEKKFISCQTFLKQIKQDELRAKKILRSERCPTS